jgi:hypothetical protein
MVRIKFPSFIKTLLRSPKKHKNIFLIMVVLLDIYLSSYIASQEKTSLSTIECK